MRDTHRTDDHSDQMHPGDPFVEGKWWFDETGRYLPHRFVDKNVHARRRAFRYFNLVEVLASRASIKMSWDVAHVSPLAIMMAGRFLTTRLPTANVTLEYFWGAWNRETSLSPAAAIKRMADIASYRDVVPYSGTMVVRRPLHSVRSEGNLIRSTFESWDRDGAYFMLGPSGDNQLAEISKFALGFRPDRGEHRLIFDHIGEASGAVQVFGDEWARDAVGRACHRTQPDFEFDDRVCSSYAQVLETGEPYVDHIRAAIRRDGGDPVWVPYRRLVIPSRDRFGAPVVLSVCDVRQDINIPFMVA